MFKFLFISFRYLHSKKGSSERYLLGAVSSIAISLIPIMVTLIVADGMIFGITNRFLELGTGHIQLWDYSGTDENLNELLTERDIRNDIPEIRGMWMESGGLGIILGSKNKTGATIRAIDNSFWQDENAAKYLEIKSGSTVLESANEVLLGAPLAEECGALVGDTVYLMTVRINESGDSIPRTFPCTVKGIISTGYNELDSLWCVINREAAAMVLDPSMSYSYMTIKIDEPYKNALRTAGKITGYFGAGYYAYTWMELNSSQYASYQSSRQLLLFIMALIVIVASVNVTSATGMLTLERRRDIAVLKAGGVKPKIIENIFLSCGFLTGIFGTIIGGAAGLTLGVFINELIAALEKILTFFAGITSHGSAQVKILSSGYYIDIIPITINWGSVIFVCIFSILCATLAAYFPARKAAKEKPLVLLRKL